MNQTRRRQLSTALSLVLESYLLAKIPELRKFKLSSLIRHIETKAEIRETRDFEFTYYDRTRRIHYKIELTQYDDDIGVSCGFKQMNEHGNDYMSRFNLNKFPIHDPDTLSRIVEFCRAHISKINDPTEVATPDHRR